MTDRANTEPDADPITGVTVWPLLRGAFGRPYLYAHECVSTQVTLLDSALPHGTVAATDYQTHGRGRADRRWEAPPGSSLLLSLRLCPPPERTQPQLALVAGLAVAEALDAAVGAEATIKWPNDVLVDGRKVAGVLCEARSEAVVVGIGINVSQTESQLPAGTVTPAGSILTTTGRLVGRAALLADVLDHLESGYEQWLTDGLEALVVELERRNALRGLDVIAGGAPARVARIDTSGQLVVITASGEERAIASGEIEVQQWSRPS